MRQFPATSGLAGRLKCHIMHRSNLILKAMKTYALLTALLLGGLPVTPIRPAPPPSVCRRKTSSGGVRCWKTARRARCGTGRRGRIL